VPLDVRGELVALATHAAAVLNGQGVASEIAACDSLRDLPAALPEALPQWRGLAELLHAEAGGKPTEPVPA